MVCVRVAAVAQPKPTVAALTREQGVRDAVEDGHAGQRVLGSELRALEDPRCQAPVNRLRLVREPVGVRVVEVRSGRAAEVLAHRAGPQAAGVRERVGDDRLVDGDVETVIS